MAISRIPDKYKGFTFDGVDSKDFGVYIADTGAFNAPERDVEMIEIPGRNGAYALDKGRFSNIEVTYNAFVATDSESDYISGINALRNALCSRKGYCRLEDEFNPNEYRMAVYKNGLKVSSVNDKAGEFTITFDCQPQRFLKSGETAVSVASGGTITNPTLFESHPIIKFNADADGSISFGDYTVNVIGALAGRIPLDLTVDASYSTNSYISDILTIENTSLYNTGDTLTVKGFDVTIGFDMRVEVKSSYVSSDDGMTAQLTRNPFYLALRLQAATLTLTAGTASTKTMTTQINVGYGDSVWDRLDIAITASYDGEDRIDFYGSVGSFEYGSDSKVKDNSRFIGEVNSTLNTLTEPIYLDCDTGNAYSVIGGTVISMNNHISFGAETPVLPVGNAIVTYGNTIRAVSITPRWWEV